MAEASGLMRGKRGLILGVANNRSLAWGIARACRAQGAEIALHLSGRCAEEARRAAGRGDRRPRVRPLRRDRARHHRRRVQRHSSKTWGALDFVVHAIAFSDKKELDGRYVDTTADNFARTMLISCYSFVAVAQRAEKLMPQGGSLLTLTYYGGEKWMPHYNVMGVAKAALEMSVRYLAADLGQQENPRQRHLVRADQDAGGVRHRRLPLHPRAGPSTTRRCAAPSPPTRSATPPSTFCPTCRAASPPRSFTSTPAINIVGMKHPDAPDIDITVPKE